MSKEAIPINQIITGDCLDIMKGWPEGCIQMCVTSPPYWGLRDYGTASWEGGDAECDHTQVINKQSLAKCADKYAPNKTSRNLNCQDDGSIRQNYKHICPKCGAKRIDQQLGLESTPEEFVSKMVAVFAEVKRVLRDDGTLWLNLGDSYCGYKGDNYGVNPESSKLQSKSTVPKAHNIGSPRTTTLKPKDLCGIPWRVALALQADGWYLRQDIIWAKPNPMPESCTDRCTKAHEYLFLLTKKPRYFYDAEAIAEPTVYPNDKRRPLGSEGAWQMDGRKQGDNGGGKAYEHDTETKNKRSVWTVKPKSFPEAHFATFPPKLIEPCILAGTSAKGCCPECGGPWERIMEKDRRIQAHWEGTEQVKAKIAKGKHGKTSVIETGSYQTYKTTGWRPTCKCGVYSETKWYAWDNVPCVVFDPFMGAGTTAVVALQHGRSYVGTELSPEYVKIAESRIKAVVTGVPEKEAKKGQAALFK